MSSYETDFGDREKLKEASEISILKYKKFSEIPLAIILTEKAKRYLDGWLLLNDQDVFKMTVLQCLRSLFAFVNTRAVAKSNYNAGFQFNKNLVVPVERIDKRLMAKTLMVKTKPNLEMRKKTESMLKESRSATTLANAGGSTLLKLSTIREEMLRGNGYITASCFAPE
jgi:hypothetical protein